MSRRSPRGVTGRAFTGVSLAALAAVWLIAAGAPANARPTSTAGPTAHNIDISRMHGNEAEQTVAINPTNPKNVVVSSNLGEAAGVFEAYSMDGGRTWTRQILGDGTVLGSICCDVSLSFDSFGNLFFTYISNTTGKVPVALSTDGGATFAVIAQIQPTSPAAGPGGPTKGAVVLGTRASASNDQPTITTGPGSVWVTWTSEPSVVVQASGAPVGGLGSVGSFSAAQSVPTTDGKGDYGDIAIGPNGQVLVTYQFPTGGEGPAKIFTALDADGLGAGGFANPKLLTKTNVGGFDFIPPQSGRSVDAESGLAYDRSGGAYNGRVYNIWTSETPDESDNTDIMFDYSDDNGSTWTSPVRVNDDGGTNSQFNPKIALDQKTGAFAITFYDARSDLGQGGSGDTNGQRNDDAQVWGTYSLNGGTSFLANFRISAGTSNAAQANSGVDYGDYAALAAQSGRFYPVWADNSNSTGDNPDGTLNQFDLLTVKIRFS